MAKKATTQVDIRRMLAEAHATLVRRGAFGPAVICPNTTPPGAYVEKRAETPRKSR